MTFVGRCTGLLHEYMAATLLYIFFTSRVEVSYYLADNSRKLLSSSLGAGQPAAPTKYDIDAIGPIPHHIGLVPYKSSGK